MTTPDDFFKRVFGDSEPTHVGSGWFSGVGSIFLGFLGFGGALCLHFPALLTLPDARVHYPMHVIRLLIQGAIVAALVLGAISSVLRQRKVLALTGLSFALAAALLGGGGTPLPEEISSKTGIGFDWFLLDLLVMTLVFLPVERLWPLHPNQGTFRPEWTTDYFYFLVTHLPAQLLTLLMVLPATMLAHWLAIPNLPEFWTRLPYIVQLLAAILVADVAQVLVHRAFHAIPLLWRFHAVHHSIRTLDWIAGSRSHLIDIVFTRGLIMIPIALLGFSQGVLAGYLVFVSFHATFCHTDFRPDPVWLQDWIVTPRYHHWHHAAEPEAVNCNFAIHFPFIDRIFGTCHFPTGRWPERYGLLDASMPAGFFAQLVAPFRRRRVS